MRSSINSLFFSCFLLLIPAVSLPAQVIQLPTLRVFNVRTSVSVPDGGTVSLGGVNRSATGSLRRGVPGRSGRSGRLVNSRGIGRSRGSNRAAATAQVIVLSELEAELLAEARRLREKAAITDPNADPNGPPVVQHQADFITRNIGRSRKR